MELNLHKLKYRDSTENGITFGINVLVTKN